MPKWELKLDISSGGLPQRQLDGISACGWELVSETVVRDSVRAVFKRKVQVHFESVTVEVRSDNYSTIYDEKSDGGRMTEKSFYLIVRELSNRGFQITSSVYDDVWKKRVYVFTKEAE